jgi:hypothetical protein
MPTSFGGPGPLVSDDSPDRRNDRQPYFPAIPDAGHGPSAVMLISFHPTVVFGWCQRRYSGAVATRGRSATTAPIPWTSSRAAGRGGQRCDRGGVSCVKDLAGKRCGAAS